jgi:hypothetical protein
MKKHGVYVVVVVVILVVGFWTYKNYSKSSVQENSVYVEPLTMVGESIGTFEGRFPCQTCERTKVRLTLFEDQLSPTTYVLHEVFVGQSDSVYTTYGTWKKIEVVGSNSVVYELNPERSAVENSESPTYYLKIDENILLLLDQNLNTRIGNASYSFTLSRTE